MSRTQRRTRLKGPAAVLIIFGVLLLVGVLTTRGSFNAVFTAKLVENGMDPAEAVNLDLNVYPIFVIITVTGACGMVAGAVWLAVRINSRNTNHR
ncbi:MAG: hypothetical protein Q8P61_09035 [Candidatus Nanopelagicales bacterium]|nr:hypothetical protein [Candidatus Nanopelagicales bacterium]